MASQQDLLAHKDAQIQKLGTQVAELRMDCARLQQDNRVKAGELKAALEVRTLPANSDISSRFEGSEPYGSRDANGQQPAQPDAVAL